MAGNTENNRQDVLERLTEENAFLRTTLENNDHGGELIRQREEFSMILAISKLIVSELNLDLVFQLVADQALELVQAEMVLVPMLNEDRDRYTYMAAAGADSQAVLEADFPVTTGMCGWVLQNEQSLLFGEASPCWLDETTAWEQGQQSAVLVPLFGRRQIIGGLSALGKKGGGSFSRHDLDLLTVFANQISTAIENAIMFQRLQREIEVRKQAENLLRASESRLQLATSAGNIGIWDWDIVNNELIWDDSMYSLYGIRKEDFGGAYEAWVNTLHPEDRRFAEEEIQAALQGEREYGPELRIVRPDGSIRIIKTDSKTIRDDNDKPLRMIGTTIDITERREAAAALAAEKERLTVTLRSIGDGVIAVDLEKKIVVINKVAEVMTGWSYREALGRPYQEVFQIINERTGQPCENPVEKVLQSGRIIELANHTVLIARDGIKRSIADSGAPIHDAESRVIGVVLVFRDVTEREKTEKELLRIQKIESVGVLAGGIAHDFNNILAAILGNISVSLIDKGLSETTRVYLLEAEKASLRARDLTQQLLTFSKGGAPITEVSSLVEVIKDSANFILRGKQATCQFSFPEDLWLACIDRGQISQVIQNIVLNACQAMAGKGLIRITCANVDGGYEHNPPGLPAGRYIKISISDDGPGIPAEAIDKIFDPYFSTKKEGSGLGLAICHAIISKHDGQILVNSGPEGGTAFTIYLPVTCRGEIPAPKEMAAPCPAEGHLKILMMDDDEMIREVAKAMLTVLGYEIILATDGREAIDIYRDSAETIDLIIMDLTVPGGMGGKEAAQEILKINPAAKIIVSSGYSNDPIMANFSEFGFSAALVKPYRLEEFTRVVNQLTPCRQG